MSETECDVCGGIIDDEYATECPHCGAYYCESCECFTDEWDGDSDSCLDCRRDSAIYYAESLYDLD